MASAFADGNASGSRKELVGLPDFVADPELDSIFFVGQKVNSIWNHGTAVGHVIELDHAQLRARVRYPPPYAKSKFDLWFDLCKGLVTPFGAIESHGRQRRVLRSGKKVVANPASVGSGCLLYTSPSPRDRG